MGEGDTGKKSEERSNSQHDYVGHRRMGSDYVDEDAYGTGYRETSIRKELASVDRVSSQQSPEVTFSNGRAGSSTVCAATAPLLLG
uniref:Uncharacterized protein n=1 Tax=Vespula pensylvanica TaxID=30213 RepID=A0A834PEB6_VESPE|nr:hypothetical protein H0235_004150 [Vespula pensylvanica]